MEFKFRAADDRPPPPPSASSSSFGFFSEEALRAGCSNNEQTALVWQSEILQRHIAKERIREEIIAAEILQRRALEAEVRIELMLERRMAMQRGGGGAGPSFPQTLITQLDKRMPFDIMGQFNNRSLNDTSPIGSISTGGLFNLLPMLPRQPEPLVSMAPKVKSPPETNSEKLIVLAKPEPNLCGAKRKLAAPPIGCADEFPFSSLKKRKIEEWSCALCQVNAPSEKGLNEHMKGKKHKAKEAGLRRARHSSTVGMVQEEDKVLGQSIQVNKSDAISDKNIKTMEEIGNRSGELPMLKTKHLESLKEKNKKATVQSEERQLELTEKKFRFWCEMCQIGAHSSLVMDDHKRGKKHTTQLQNLGKNGETTLTSANVTTTALSESGEKGKQLDTTEAMKNNDEAILTSPNVTTIALSESGEEGKQLGETAEAMKTNGEATPTSATGEKGKQSDETAEAMKNNSEATLRSANVTTIALSESGEIGKQSDETAEAMKNNGEATLRSANVTTIALSESGEKGKLSDETAEAMKSETENVGVDVQNSSAELPMQKNQHPKRKKKKKKNGTAPVDEGMLELKKFTYWCKICQIGAHSEVVMEGHIKGKKHASQIKKVGQNGAKI